jgi:hypothetical protein
MNLPRDETQLYSTVLRSVMWDEPREEIFALLERKGMTDEQADEMFHRALSERIALIRSEGARVTVKGALLLISGIGLFCIFWFGIGVMLRGIMIISALLCGWGGWRLADGLIDIVFAATKKGSVAPD